MTFTPVLGAVVILMLAALVLLCLAFRLHARSGLVTALGLAGAILATLPAIAAPSSDLPAILGVCTLTALALLLLPSLEIEEAPQRPEVAALLLLGASGGIILATQENLLSLALGLETLSLSVAVMTALGRGSRPLEAGFKYFILAALSFAALLYGIGLYALATGSLSIGARPPTEPGMVPVYFAGLALIALGLGFELAVAPFHWGPLNAYLAAPPGLSGFVMGVSKLGAALALARLAVGHGLALDLLLVWLGLISIVWGTLAALAQRTLRGLLGYSAIVNAGFIALALGSGADGRAAAVFYALTYGVTVALAFAALSGLGTASLPLRSLVAPTLEADAEDSLADRPLGALRSLMLALALLSLTGVPPLPGFWAKLAVLGPLLQTAGWLPTLVAVVGGVAGALYYLRPLPDLYAGLKSGLAGREAIPSGAPVVAALALAAIAVLAFGLAPGLAYALATLSQARG